MRSGQLITELVWAALAVEPLDIDLQADVVIVAVERKSLGNSDVMRFAEFGLENDLLFVGGRIEVRLVLEKIPALIAERQQRSFVARLVVVENEERRLVHDLL